MLRLWEPAMISLVWAGHPMEVHYIQPLSPARVIVLSEGNLWANCKQRGNRVHVFTCYPLFVVFWFWRLRLTLITSLHPGGMERGRAAPVQGRIFMFQHTDDRLNTILTSQSL